MFKQMLAACVVLALAVGSLLAQSNDPTVVTARKTLQTYDKAIITLAAVVKVEVKGGEVSGSNQERKTQCIAAIVDPSGLVITSLTNLGPKMRLNRGGQTLEVEFQVQEVKYRLTDGTEVPARVVLKDDDLDVAFLAPLKPLDKATEAKIAAIPMIDAVPQPEPLDQTIMISRTSEDLNYIPTLNIARIVSIVSTPRTCYLSSVGGLGVPVFNHQGKMLGMVCRCVKTEGNEGGPSTGSTMLNQLILPAADILKLVPQAKEEAKKPVEDEKKPEEGEKKSAEPEKKPAAEKKPAEPAKKSAGPAKKPAAEKKPA